MRRRVANVTESVSSVATAAGKIHHRFALPTNTSVPPTVPRPEERL
jgi:hypothetical protein